jgi:hypothetical protein
VIERLDSWFQAQTAAFQQQHIEPTRSEPASQCDSGGASSHDTYASSQFGTRRELGNIE